MSGNDIPYRLPDFWLSLRSLKPVESFHRLFLWVLEQISIDSPLSPVLL